MDLVQINEWIKILEPVGALILGIVGGLMMLTLWHKLKPWLELQDKKTKAKKKRIKKLKQILKEDRSDEIRKKALTEFWKLVAVDGVQIVILLAVSVLIVLLSLGAGKYFEYDLWESRNEIVQIIDESKHDLYLRTKRELIDPVCVSEKKRSIDENNKCIQYWEREQDILNRQSLCRSKALLESYKIKNTTDEITKIQIAKISYQVCMSEEGWITEPCAKEEKDCVELLYVESTCTSLIRDWLIDGGGDTLIKLCEKSRSW